jgi:anti-sigma B factor antagonist
MKHEVKDGILIISLEGNLLGEHTNMPVIELVKQHLESGTKKVLFNLSETKFVNSTGLGMLLSAITKTRSAGGELALCSLPDQMKKLLQMTKLEGVFNSQPDEASALAFLKGVNG